jgi:DnaJ-class molecular chaperone
MSSQPDPYRILGVRPGASLDEIQRAFHQKARLYHPDVSDHPDAEQMFKAVNTAYQTIRHEQPDSSHCAGSSAFARHMATRRSRQARRGNPWRRRNSFEDNVGYWYPTALLLTIMLLLDAILSGLRY